ncbi:MAG: ABC transporter permease [Candidatus Pacearchaeota archaeon]|nr:ABC transporter permease [Candidatus Pacearchaeota archaeon]
MIKDYFVLAIKNIRRRHVRSWLTIIGIFVSIAIIFVLISLSLGLESAMKEQIRTLGADKLFIYPTLAAGIPGPNSPIKMSIDEVDVISRISGVKAVSYISMENGKIKFNNQIKYFLVFGIPLVKDSISIFTEATNLKMDEGKFLSKGDRGYIILGSEFKYGKLFEKPLKTGDNIILNNRTFKVKGILKTFGNPQDDSQTYINIEDLKDIFNTSTRVDYIIVQVHQGADLKEVSARIEKKLRDFRKVTEKTQDFSIVTPEELLSSIKSVLNILTAFLIGVATISLIVGAVGIANTMYTSVLERYKEIGVMKAVGARNSDILKIFLIESGLLGLVGGIFGILFGFGVGKIIQQIAITYLHITSLQPSTPPSLIFGCLVFAFIVGSLAGTIPAYKASQIKPVQALRYE